VDVGFETVGNATLICHDGGPVLVTDPWLSGHAYFGSWTVSHQIPSEQRESIQRCRFIWLSHGHPDHLCLESLAALGARHKQILLPDHVGGRIRDDLRALGLSVRVLPDRSWVSLSDRIRVLCIADYNQDAVLLVDLGGRLIIDQNDASARGWGPSVRRVARRYPVSFLLRLFGYGDADMINLFAEDGQRIPPAAAEKDPVGPRIARAAGSLGARFVIPFSSMHRYQRADSLWANGYTTRLSDYPQGFSSRSSELLPAFIRYDCATDTAQRINPPETPVRVREPREFGDDWSEPLEAGDRRLLAAYFRRILHLGTFLDFVAFRVGGEESLIELAPRRFRRGITFEAPRHSLVSAVTHEVFDDLLIGNFMRTTLHGRWPRLALRPDFTPYVAKYGDGGRAHTTTELAAYFRTYRRRAPFEFVRHRIRQRAMDTIWRHYTLESAGWRLARSAYRAWRRARAAAS
jgi:hypothetical protein